MKSPDLSQFLGVFIDEGQEQIDLLESHLLDMERETPSAETLQVMFRAAHTLKGSSRTMGFLRIGDLTHEMENALDDLRHEKIGLSNDLTNALLTSLDLLKEMIAGVQDAGNDQSFDQDRIQKQVAAIVGARSGACLTANPEPPRTKAAQEWPEETLCAAEAAASANMQVRAIEVTLREDCILKSVRAHMVFAALSELGEPIGSLPSEQDIEDDNFDQAFTVALATVSSDEEVTKAILAISEIGGVKITDWAAPDNQPVPDPVVEAAPPDAVAAAPAAGTPVPKQAQSATIRVPVARLDSLLNLIGELVIERSQVNGITHALEDKYGHSDLLGQLQETSHRFARVTGELQDEIMKARLLPIDGVFQRMPRMVRDVAQKINKKIDLQISGGDTELDRGLLDVIGDPIIHLLRNSVDHGVEEPEARIAAGKPETGTIRLAARHENNQIVIEVADDGKGIDLSRLREKAVSNGILTAAQSEAMSDADALKLIYASGLSTAKEVTDVSGRGVGMDIVKSNIEKLGGRIEIYSTVGVGTTMRVLLPLTLAIVRALLVKCGTALYAVPLASVVETIRVGAAENAVMDKVSNQAVLVLRGETVPMANLLQVLEGDPTASIYKKIAKDSSVVVVGFGDKKAALCVDQLIGEQEIVIKPLGKLLGDIHGISGASILGDGRVALIVDCAKVVGVR